MKTDFRFHFKPVKRTQRSLVHKWLKQSHVAEWFYGQGLENTIKHLDEFLNGSASAHYWLGYEGDHPFAFLITSSIDKNSSLNKWRMQEGEAITLDLFIGDLQYLGKGYAVQLIREFLSSQFSHVSEVLIDPEASNLKAIHVYEKAGFKKVGEFIPSYNPHPHVMMRLNFKRRK